MGTPPLAPPAGLILTPGASADRDHTTLVALEDGLAEIEVLRLTLGTTSVPRAVRLITEAAARLAADLAVEPSQIALGGRSFGGRCCSVAHADGVPAHSLILLSYPLHPPGKPDKLRVEHFDQIEAPCLLVSGERDPFGSPEEFATQLDSVTAPVSVEWVAGAHAPNDDAEILRRVRDWYGLD